MGPRRHAHAAVLAALQLVAGCAAEDETPAGVDLDIRYPTSLGLDRVAVTATAGDEDVMDRTLLPPVPRPLESGREGVIILVSDDLDGTKVRFRVDGLADGDLVASGDHQVEIHLDELVKARIDIEALDDEDDDADDDSSGPGS